MPTIEDHSYLKVCAELASCLSISLSSARRKVEIALAKEGQQGLNERKTMAKKLLKAACLDSEKNNGKTASSELDDLLKALAEDENFMIED
tara:strand:+ start:188 stop:460 length:273 start_codon:yes stop_codon:yes gene_type:complete